MNDPIVAEVKRIRESLWQEAGRDLSRMGEFVRRAAASVAPAGPTLANAEELRRYVEQHPAGAPVWGEEPPPYGA